MKKLKENLSKKKFKMPSKITTVFKPRNYSKYISQIKLGLGKDQLSFPPPSSTCSLSCLTFDFRVLGRVDDVAAELLVLPRFDADRVAVEVVDFRLLLLLVLLFVVFW